MHRDLEAIFEGCSPECRERFKQFMKDQIKEINVHKWIESEKAGHDLGQEAVLDWLKKYAKDYRDEWEREHGKIMADDE